MSNKRYLTSTYANSPLKINLRTSQWTFKHHLAEIEATINQKTGEVKFFIKNEDLTKLDHTHY